MSGEGAVNVRVSRVRGGLSLTIPDEAAAAAGLVAGATVDVRVRGGELVVAPALPRYRLEDLLAETSPEDLRAAFEWDPPAGREHV